MEKKKRNDEHILVLLSKLNKRKACKVEREFYEIYDIYI